MGALPVLHLHTMDKVKAKIAELVPDVVKRYCGSPCNCKIETIGVITLGVVLRAIHQAGKGKSILVNSMGGFDEYKFSQGEMGLWRLGDESTRWNLEHDNYDQQSDECKQFIGSLLLIHEA